MKNDLFAETSQLIVEMVYEHFIRDPANACLFASDNIACRKRGFEKLGGFDTVFPRAGAQDRDLCDRWRAVGFKLLFRRNAAIEHRHAQLFREFLALHFRYGRGAFTYKEKRRVRSTGTMREDFWFHKTLPRRIWHRLRGTLGYLWSMQIFAAHMIWQFVNAVGFFAESFNQRMIPPR